MFISPGSKPQRKRALSISAGGSTTQVQYNNAGAFAGSSGLTYDSTNLALTVGGGTLSGASSVPVINASQTWNNAGTTFTGLKLNVTNTASASGSLLADFQIGGTSVASIGYNGTNSVFNLKSTTSTVYNMAGSGASLLFYYNSSTSNGPVALNFGIPGVQLPQNGNFSWGASVGNPDLILCRDAANVLALRNGTNAQVFRAYNTYTDSSNGEWWEAAWSSNVCYVRPNKNGTGQSRIMVPVTGSTTVSSLPAASTAGAGARAFVTDATATTFLSTVAGSGSNKVPVVSDGTNWLIG